MARLNIFLSYVKEDQSFADAVAERLTSAFKMAVQINYMSQFPQGTNWRTHIDEALDSSDVLLIIATGHEKLSHSFTGYEVGFFRRSQQNRKHIDREQHVERMVIPFAMYADIPATVSDIQGVEIAEENSFLFTLDTAGKIGSKRPDPFLELLVRFDKMVNQLDPFNRSAAQEQVALDSYRHEAKLFYEALVKLISLLPLRTECPKTRLQLRLPADFSLNGEVDNRVLLSCNGQAPGIFQQEQSDKCVPWDDFSKRIGSTEIALNWKDALQSLVTATLGSDFQDSDQLVLSYDEKKLFRLFVSKSTTFVDRTRAVDIYVLETPLDKDAGDPATTFIGKALAIALTYRSLFLEPGSPYGPSIRFWPEEQWKTKTNQLVREMRLLSMKSRQAGLGQPSHIVDLYGADRKSISDLVIVMRDFRALRDKLYKSAAAVAAESQPSNATFDEFVATLDEFRLQTKSLNADFISRLLERLDWVLQQDKAVPTHRFSSLSPATATTAPQRSLKVIDDSCAEPTAA